MIPSTMDHEDRANRFLDAMGCVRDMLAIASPGSLLEPGDLAQLLALLNDEARKVIVPFRRAINDDEDDSG